MDGDHSNGGFVETGKADRSVWLMKCPVVVAKSWKAQTASSSDPLPVAKVVLSLDPCKPDDPSSMQFTMEMAGSEIGNIPKSYDLNMFKDFVPMCVFSETTRVGSRKASLSKMYDASKSPFADGSKGGEHTQWLFAEGTLAMEGKIEHKFDMKPHEENLEEYGRLCRERTNKSMIKNRQTQVIDNDRGVHMRPMPGMLGLFSSNSKDKKKTTPVKQPEVKRTRRDRGELEDIMFKLFERQPNWALKQLVQETDQPAQFLKEILNELCVYNKRGSNQGTYELKPEYKKSSEDTGAE